MGLLKKKAEALETPGGEPIQAAKEGKKRTIRATVFPREGGRPYITEVEPDDEGFFDIGEMTYQITRGSVWDESGILRMIVNEGNALTINGHNLTGDSVIDPIVLHGVANNNLWTQFGELSRRKSAWKQASTWGFILIGVGVVLLLFWQIRTLGSGFEELRQALEGLQLGGGEGQTPTDAEEAGHQPISPGSRNIGNGSE